MPDAPFQLTGFEPLDRIGSGGFGEVWLARQANIDRKVAIKVGHSPIDDKTVQLRFERECIALGRLSGHPNIIDVFTAGQLDDGRPYLVLEFVNGGTLWQRLQRGPLSEPELCRVGIQLCDALAVAHDAGVLHRDLKPENVLLRQNGEAVLGDFGIARLHDGANTTSHAITASVAYAAPEILSGTSASASSDLYGIGICLLASILRSVPFVEKTDESIHSIINRVLNNRPPDLHRHFGLSEGLDHTIATLLDKRPERRPATARDVKTLLERAANPPPPSSAAPSNRTVAVADPRGSARPAVSDGATQVASGAPPHPANRPAAVASSGHAPSPARAAVESRPYAQASAPPTYITHRPQDGANRFRVFGAAFGATLLIGGLLIFTINTLSGQGTSGDTPTTVDSLASTQTPEAEGATTTSSAEGGNENEAGQTTAPGSAPVPPAALTLPLNTDDLNLGGDVVTDPDRAGPDSPQFCDNTPVTVGLSDWLGETYTNSTNIPVIFQELVRFDTAGQATAYVTSYAATVDCVEWLITNEDGSEVAFRPAIVPTPATQYGDDTREFTFEGEASFATVIGRLAMVRQGADVYLLSLTSVLESDLDDLDRLLSLAVDRLAFDG